jgi:putative endonuclease
MKRNRIDVGREGEDVVASLYSGTGFRVVARNWRCRAGEIDLVVERGGLFVFCEVKTRTGERFGGGYEAVTTAKQARLRRLAELFLYESARMPDSVRFDVASVLVSRHAQPDVQIFDDAF